MNDKFYYYLDQTNDKLSDFFIKENYAICYDNTITSLFSNPSNYTYYEVSNVREF